MPPQSSPSLPHTAHSLTPPIVTLRQIDNHTASLALASPSHTICCKSLKTSQTFGSLKSLNHISTIQITHHTNQPTSPFLLFFSKFWSFSLSLRFIVSTSENLGEKDRVETQIQDHIDWVSGKGGVFIGWDCLQLCSEEVWIWIVSVLERENWIG